MKNRKFLLALPSNLIILDTMKKRSLQLGLRVLHLRSRILPRRLSLSKLSFGISQVNVACMIIHFTKKKFKIKDLEFWLRYPRSGNLLNFNILWVQGEINFKIDATFRFWVFRINTYEKLYEVILTYIATFYREGTKKRSSWDCSHFVSLCSIYFRQL